MMRGGHSDNDRVLPSDGTGVQERRSVIAPHTPSSRSGTDTPESEGLFSQNSSALNSQYFGGGSELSLNSVNGSTDIPRAHPYIDNLCRKLELSPKQSADLHELVGMGNSFAPEELLFRLTEQANSFKTHNLLYALLNQGKTITSAISDLQVQISPDFKLSGKQKEDLLGIVKDALFDAKHTSYNGVASRVKNVLQKKKDLGFSDIFGKSHRVKVLDKELRLTCRNAKNQYRLSIKNFTFGEKRLNFKEFCTEMSVKYEINKTGKYSEDQMKRLAILRRFARENQDILGVEGEDSSDEADGEDQHGDIDDGVSETTTRSKRKRVGSGITGQVNSRSSNTGGKRKGWWRTFDSWLQKQYKLWGSDLTGGQWKVYIDETISFENIDENREDEFLSYGSLISTHQEIGAFRRRSASNVTIGLEDGAYSSHRTSPVAPIPVNPALSPDVNFPHIGHNSPTFRIGEPPHISLSPPPSTQPLPFDVESNRRQHVASGASQALHPNASSYGSASTPPSTQPRSYDAGRYSSSRDASQMRMPHLASQAFNLNNIAGQNGPNRFTPYSDNRDGPPFTQQFAGNSSAHPNIGAQSRGFSGHSYSHNGHLDGNNTNMGASGGEETNLNTDSSLQVRLNGTTGEFVQGGQPVRQPFLNNAMNLPGGQSVTPRVGRFDPINEGRSQNQYGGA